MILNGDINPLLSYRIYKLDNLTSFYGIISFIVVIYFYKYWRYSRQK